MQLVTMGLVLRQTKVGEADSILSILTPGRGVITASAKGSLRLKNKLFSGCGLFCYSEFTLFEGRTMFRVDEAQVKNSFFGLRQSVEGTALAMYMAEMAAALAPVGEEADNQLRLLLNSLYLISEQKKPLHQIKAVYELRTICAAGYMPDILCCRGCGRYDGTPFYFDPAGGHLLCESCAAAEGKRPNLDPAALTALRHIALMEDKKIFAFSIKDESMELLGQAAESYALGRLDKPMKSLAFLKAMLG